MEKDALENYHARQFLNIINLSENILIPQSPPEPDFVLNINGEFIGLEHTRLIRNSDQNKVSIKAHSLYANQIMSKAEYKYSLINGMCLNVGVDFRSSYGLATSIQTQLTVNDVEPLSDFICNFIQDNYSLISEMKHNSSVKFEAFDFNVGRRILPEKIDFIRITNTKEFKTPCWFAYQGAVIPEIYSSNEFKEILIKKNKKPSNYKKYYKEIWLLIVEDSMDLTSYFYFENYTPIEVTTTFNRVFILRRASNEIIELITKL